MSRRANNLAESNFPLISVQRFQSLKCDVNTRRLNEPDSARGTLLEGRQVPVACAMTLEDTLRYLYLPRLKSRAVLEHAIVKGAGTRDFFSTAYGEHGRRFDGFSTTDTNRRSQSESGWVNRKSSPLVTGEAF